jgi:hypothetical protein
MKKQLLFLLGLLLYAQAICFAASPLFHAAIAEKWLETFENYTPSEERDFLLGTLFPDIRYLAAIPRQVTHESGLTLEKIYATQDPFLKGMRVHVFVDMIREKFVKEQKILDKLTKASGDKILSLKFLEDEILYSMRKTDASLYISDYLKSFAEAELRFNIPLEILSDWHEINANYFRDKPSVFFEYLVATKEGFGGSSSQTALDCYQTMQLYADDPELKLYVISAIEEFERIFNEFKTAPPR